LLGFGLVVLVFVYFGASLWFSLIFFIWLILAGGNFIYRLVNWYLNKYIFTDKRVIAKEQIGLFKRLTTEARISEITSISYQVNGFWAMIFNYGDIFIETERSEDPVVLPDIGRPGQIKEELMELRDNFS
jgi:uncharacterized membrane protein YdbT with pleckstrin-like domain